ncbi:MAG TPA: hypothetical protein DCS93_22070 [Microscillaceae bacterium]|nr:hypothetical protein [Microscillaceae bacterium]
MKKLRKYWEEISTHLTKIVGQNLINFQAKGANLKEINKLATQVGCELPEDFKDFLTLFNEYQSVVFFEYKALSISEIYDNWRLLTSLKSEGEFEHLTPWYIKEKAPVKFTWWDEKWIPFAEDDNGNLICLDLAPNKKGEKGQVFYWETVGGPGMPEAKSFIDFVKGYKKALEKGKFNYDKDLGNFVTSSNLVEA